MTCRVENGLTYKQEFNAENRLIAVYKMNGTCTGGTVLETTSFIYDGDGNLVKKINPNGSKTLYVGGIYEVDKASGGSVTRTVTYYPVAGAMRINSTLYYILKDHLGSASVVTDASGNILGEQRYYPFGETRLTTGTIYTDKLFTGQREMAGLGIYHYQTRFYSPKIGRFLSADTIVPDPINPQAFNRYSYVINNPLKYTDPTGHDYCLVLPWLCGGPLPYPPAPPTPVPNPPRPPREPRPEPGPIEFPTEPMPIIIGGPIVILGPGPSPKEEACKSLKQQWEGLINELNALGRQIKDLQAALAKNPDQAGELEKQIKDLFKKLNEKQIKAENLLARARMLGCDFAGK